jgi:outer membrane receptor protein involved in Fe transport
MGGVNMRFHYLWACVFPFGMVPALAEEKPAEPQTVQEQGQTAPQPFSAGSNAPQKPATQLPPVKVIQNPEAKKPRPPTANARERGTATAAQGTAGQTTATGTEQVSAANAAVVQKANELNAARENILPKIGANTYQLNEQEIKDLPQGDNVPVDKLLLQAPGIYQDSAASGNLHIRNEHANLQYRIDGIQLPDGVSGFGNVLETSLIANMAVVTGALPAQYGLRTAGLVDIQTRMGSPDPAGEISIYGGSHGTINTNLQYSGVSGDTQYFFTGRWLENSVGIENPTSTYNAIHDETEQEKFFSYVSTVLPNNSRWVMIMGAGDGQYQIPNNPGQSPVYCTPTTCNFDSGKLNEQQFEQNYYAVLAFQQSTAFADYQFSYFTRYSDLHFIPDPAGDLIFNGIATDVERSSFLNGIQADAAFRIAPDHTLRAGFVVSGEQTYVTDNATVFLSGTTPLNTAQNGQLLASGAPAACLTNLTPNCVANPIQVLDKEDKFGWIAGVYIQDEWRITDKLTLNTGLRFDQMWQYVDANQLSPRVAAVYKPLDGTTFHAGYARYFTPPPQAVGAPENYALFAPTVAAAVVYPGAPGLNRPVVISPSLPERSHYFDAGVTQIVLPGLEVGLDAYYKIATDLIDDGQFGQAYVLTAFNYAKADNEGLEAKIKYSKDGVLFYGNLAYGRQVATQFVSNQYLISVDDYNYALTNFIHTDHDQMLTASAGFSYPIWDHTKASMDMIYGSGLRDGDHNSGTLPPYSQLNLGLSHEFILPDWKPFTVRFDAVNLFDEVYELRNGSGIGVFAPQWGPRRGFFVGFSQKF